MGEVASIPLDNRLLMNAVLPASDSSPARWLLEAGVDWWTLVRYGPPGFEAYLRISFSDADPVRAALAILAAHTTTPAVGYAAVWEGWGCAPNPEAPRVEIPHRTMLLFTGPVEVLRDAPALAWRGASAGILQEPHLVWPADHAWCLACEVDDEIEFTVGCSSAAATALTSAVPGVRVVVGPS